VALQAAQRLSSGYKRRPVEIIEAIAQSNRLLALGRWREGVIYSATAARIAREDRREGDAAVSLVSGAQAFTMVGDPQTGVDLAKKAWSWPAPPAALP
jgi:hypothetical protein